MNQNTGIRRSISDRVIGGVCGGLAVYLKLDPVLIRIIFVLLTVFGGGGLLAYIILWIVLPEENILLAGENGKNEPDTETREQAAGSEHAAADARPEPIKKTYNAQFTGGIILIAVGMLFLFNTFIPGFMLFHYWPIILIVVGVLVMRPAFKS